MKINLVVTGDAEIDRAFRELASNKETRRSIKGMVRKGTREAAKTIRPQVERNILREAYDSGELLEHVKVRAKKRSRVSIGHRIFTGWYTGETFYGAFQEWGWRTAKRPGRGTFGKSVDIRPKVEGKFFAWHAAASKQQRAIWAFRGTIRRELEKVWRRLP